MRILIALLVALPVSATTVVLQRDGVAVRGEVCRFAAGDRENPLERWLSSQDVTCVPSDAPLEIPKGLWNVFGRTAERVSEPVLVEGEAAPPQLTFELRAATAIEPILPPGAAAVVYAPRLAVAFPSPGLAPANEPLWLLVIERSRLNAVMAVTGARVDARQPGPPAMIGWLKMPVAVRERQAASDLNAPALSVYGPAGTAAADVLPPVARLDGAFVRIAGVSAGAGELVVEGRGWVRYRRALKIAPALTVVPEPIPLRAAGTLIVHWSTDQDLPALDRSIGSCERDDGPAAIEVTVSLCAEPRRPGQAFEPEDCSPVRKETFGTELRFGSFTLDDLVPGFYRAEMKYGKLPPISNAGAVVPLEQRRLSVFAGYAGLYGSLTHGGKPLDEDARVTLPGGVGFAAENSDEYRAAVIHAQRIPPDSQVHVEACDGSPRVIVLTDRVVQPGSRFDIDIPDNELAISITDTFTSEPLGATVKMDVMSMRMPNRPVLSRTLTAGETGRIVVKSVPEREIRLSVSHGGYQRQEVPPFTIGKSETKSVEVQLVPLRGNRGRIVSARPFENAMAYWFSPAGAETERAEVSADGTVVTSSVHEATETVTIVSSSHPLWITRSPKIEPRGSLTLRFPDEAPLRQFEVTVSSGGNRYLALALGGLRVPRPVLAMHQQLRRQAATVREKVPARFRDIVESGPIDVILGPEVEEVPSRVAAMDLFALPAYADAPRQRLAPGAQTVRFQLQ